MAQQQLMSGSSSCSSYGATTRKCPTGPHHHPQCSNNTADKEPGNENRHRGSTTTTTMDPDITAGFDLPPTSGTDFDDDLLFFTSLNANSRHAHIRPRSPSAFCRTLRISSPRRAPHFVTNLQAQNREAQRRSRERREQERTHLLELLQKLGAENERISSLLDQTREKYLTLDADILRRWRQEMMSSMTGLIQHQDLAEEVLEAVA
ncbi:hypothetical protein BJY01DRAFT_250569 [Aspergillus pseudoustus]|uniref:BZIP domain-containing protein n=1 Tax=Aspergillus pseudoustus TaxID=1810923 RepID=A0ABR4JGT7_9EURO